jgi:hypothetical protein
VTFAHARYAALTLAYKLARRAVLIRRASPRSSLPFAYAPTAFFTVLTAAVKKSHPELVAFDDEVTGLVFSFCDTDHSGKVDPVEVVAYAIPRSCYVPWPDVSQCSERVLKRRERREGETGLPSHRP